MNQFDFENLKYSQRLEPFYFYRSLGNYSGHKASNLEEFVQEISRVDVCSLEFHLERGDFENWLLSSLKEPELAKDVEMLRKQTVMGDSLRTQLTFVVRRRLKSSKELAKSSVSRKNKSVRKKIKPSVEVGRSQIE
jgi:hypothetical protein